MKTMLALVLCLWGAVGLLGLPLTERLVYEGKEHILRLYNPNLLDPFIRQNPDKDPEKYFQRKRKEARQKHEEAMRKYEEGEGDKPSYDLIPIEYRSSWGGHENTATFEVRDEQLFLTDIQVAYPDFERIEESGMHWKYRSIMAETFPGNPVLKVDWWTGMLTLSSYDGKWIEGSGWTHEKHSLLEIREGNVIKTHNLIRDEYEAFKTKHYEILEKYERGLYEKRVHEIYKQSAPLREKKEDEENFVEPTKDERALYMFEQEVKILNDRQGNL